MNLGDVISEIENLDHRRSLDCPACGSLVRHHALDIYADCSNCKKHSKVRAFGGMGTEIHDVIDAVLTWIVRDESPEDVINRLSQMKRDAEANGEGNI